MRSTSASIIDYCKITGGDTLVKHILKEYTGVDKAGNKISPYEVTYGSNREVYWKCENGHLRLQKISHKLKHPYAECPLCKAQRLNKLSLYDWCKTHRFGGTIEEEWAGKDINNNTIDIKDISYIADLSVQWKCRNGHSWSQSVVSRTTEQQCCKICTEMAKTVNKDYSVETLLNKMKSKTKFVQIKGYTGVSPKDIWYRSRLNTVWRCKKGHLYEMTPYEKCIEMHKCPKCIDDDVWGERGLDFWCRNNATKGKTIQSEWTGFTSLGDKVNMSDIDTFDTKQMIWRCNNNHIYQATIKEKVYANKRCPICNKKYTSIQYSILCDIVNNSFCNIKNRVLLSSSTSKDTAVIDFILKDKNLAILFIPTYYGNYNVDWLRQELKNNKIRLLTITECTDGTGVFKRDCDRITCDFLSKDFGEKLIYSIEHTGGDKNGDW